MNGPLPLHRARNGPPRLAPNAEPTPRPKSRLSDKARRHPIVMTTYELAPRRQQQSQDCVRGADQYRQDRIARDGRRSSRSPGGGGGPREGRSRDDANAPWAQGCVWIGGGVGAGSRIFDFRGRYSRWVIFGRDAGTRNSGGRVALNSRWRHEMRLQENGGPAAGGSARRRESFSTSINNNQSR